MNSSATVKNGTSHKVRITLESTNPLVKEGSKGDHLLAPGESVVLLEPGQLITIVPADRRTPA